MINLIPPQGHKVVKREYTLRLGAALAFLFAGVLLLLSVALIPTYVLVGAQIEAFEFETAQEVGDAEALKNAEKEVRTMKNVLTQMKTTVTSTPMSKVIAEIQANAPKTIIFKNFSINTTKGVVTTVQVQGVSPTREALAQLKDALIASPIFEKAEVPISDLARETDLPFTLTVTLSPST